ncbi:MAG TPA: hypothetical protein PKZ75_04750 [Bacteroidia bacterium]|nr:hypothetical protein [Bacteroidia bacterium]
MSDTLNTQKEHILKLLKEKSVMKQDVFRNTIASFELLKKCVDEIAKELNAETQAIDKRIVVSTLETTSYSTQLKVAGDMLEFFMHTNVFEFEKTHAMFRTGYVKQNEYNSYCGIINVYNFLADSFKFNRLNDLGYLVCRIFINREMKFFIEAKGPIGVKYSSFSDAPLNKEQLYEIINDLIIYAITFDLFTPPIEQVREVSVNEIQEKVSSINLRTGKRLGYGTSASYDEDNNMYI